MVGELKRSYDELLLSVYVNETSDNVNRMMGLLMKGKLREFGSRKLSECIKLCEQFDVELINVKMDFETLCYFLGYCDSIYNRDGSDSIKAEPLSTLKIKTKNGSTITVKLHPSYLYKSDKVTLNIAGNLIELRFRRTKKGDYHCHEHGWGYYTLIEVDVDLIRDLVKGEYNILKYPKKRYTRLLASAGEKI